MNYAGGKQPGGTIIRGPDGALYFIRDEMLQHFRLPEKLAKDAETLVGPRDGSDPKLNTEIAKFAVDEQPRWEPLARVEGPLNEADDFDIDAVNKVASTVMCPSFLFEPGGPV